MATVEQKRGHYSVVTERGAAKLTRVTTALDWVLGDGKSAMAYYGGKQFAKYLAEPDDPDATPEWEQFYDAWKASPFDPNKTLRSRAKEGTTSHKLFENLLTGVCGVEVMENGAYLVHQDDEITYVASGYDRGVVELFLAQYQPPLQNGATIETEKRLYWTEHPIDDCFDEICTHGFAGTCDVFWPQGSRIDDLKTHVPGYRFSEWMQMAMYALAAEQMSKGEWVCKSQRIVIAHDTPDEETGLYFEVQDDRYLSPDIVDSFWELYKARRAWGPK